MPVHHAPRMVRVIAFVPTLDAVLVLSILSGALAVPILPRRLCSRAVVWARSTSSPAMSVSSPPTRRYRTAVWCKAQQVTWPRNFVSASAVCPSSDWSCFPAVCVPSRTVVVEAKMLLLTYWLPNQVSPVCVNDNYPPEYLNEDGSVNFPDFLPARSDFILQARPRESAHL